MWQSVILLDTIMPKSCIECMHFDGFKCDITEDIIEGSGENKPSTCPIRSLPQKKHDGLVFKSDGTAFTNEMEIGWNTCLEEIIKWKQY